MEQDHECPATQYTLAGFTVSPAFVLSLLISDGVNVHKSALANEYRQDKQSVAKAYSEGPLTNYQ